MDKRIFRLLLRNYNINKKPENEFRYKLQKEKDITKRNATIVKNELQILFNYLQSENPVTNSKSGISYIKIQGSGRYFGQYRSNLWIWYANKRKCEELKRKGYSTPQLLLPQLQVGIDYTGFTLAELWFEQRAVQDYGLKFIELAKQAKFRKENLGLYIFYKDDELTGHWLPFNDDNLKSLKFDLENKRINRFGLNYWVSQNTLEKIKIKNEIKKGLNELNYKIYSKLFANNVVYKSIKRTRNNNKPKKKSYRGRKEETKMKAYKYMRKAIGEVEVNSIHDKYKQKLFKHLLKRFPKAKKEKDFIDISIEGTGYLHLFEIKTNDNAVKCIREALGQVLFYLWRKKKTNKKIKLFIVGPNKFDKEKYEDVFFEYVQELLSIEIEYLSIDSL